MKRRERLDRPIMILAGGTGGHIFPGLAVANALHARGVPVTWLGADGQMETRLVPQHGIALDTIAVRGLRGKGTATLLAAPVQVGRAVLAAWHVLRARRPRAVLSFGGYAAGPGGFAAWLRGTPLIVHEQNRAPGFTNRVLAQLARRVLSGFPGTFARREEHVGNPVRAEIADVAAPERRLARHDDTLNLLVLGGSQGARALNEAVPRALASIPGVPVRVRHQCGAALEGEARAAYAAAGVDASIEPFIADMAGAYGWADLVVCRAGALTLAEVCAVGVGSLLVPFPAAVDDHQTRNAEYLVERGAARLLPQGEGLDARLASEIERLGDDRAQRMAMAVAARAIATPDAAERVAQVVMQEARMQEAIQDDR
jgi:UDP-N-acetylglucosamine--N-acetylmuramyl-(pentapeptide) pyrophosphoryl-undecaprenol N-acetylglucosamine transferase